MAGDLSMPDSFPTKEAMYAYILEHLAAHLEALTDVHKKFDASFNLTTALANASSLIYYAMNSYDVHNTMKDGGDATADDTPKPPLALHNAIVNWVGFYLLADAQYLVLGPFQGKVACTRIKVGKGVCGTAVLLGKTQCIPNVHEFPGHIACDSGSESEIVVPVRDNTGRIVGVLDVDSTVLNRFDAVDVMKLTEVVVLISKFVTFPSIADVRGKNLEPLDGRGAPADAASVATKAPFATAATVAPAAGIATMNITTTTAAPTTTAMPTRMPTTAIVRPPVVTAHNPNPSDPTTPLTKAKYLGDWIITCKHLDRIISAPEITHWEEAHKVGCIPEIVFPQNALELQFTNKKTNTRTTLTVDAESYFRSATEFYRTRKGVEVTHQQKNAEDETYDVMLEDQSFLKIPVADSWKNTKFGTFDPNIDWASRSNYLCDVKTEVIGADGSTATPSSSSATTFPTFKRSETEVINYDLLKRRDLDILVYEAFDLFEDDLHDCGISKASVKVRVMPLCIFVLIRHIVRVDAAAAVCRDVRLYAELDPVTGIAGVAGTTPENPFVVAEVTYKHMVFPSSPLGVAPGTPQQQTRQVEATDKAHLRIPLDQLVEQMQQTAPAKNYVLAL